MPTDWSVTLVLRTLDDTIVAAEPLLFSELLVCESKATRLRTTISKLIAKAVEQTPAFLLHQRILPEQAALEEAEIKLDPRERSPDWAEPVKLRFDIVRWQHGEEAHLAFVPDLGIEVIARRDAEMPKLLAAQMLATLRRTKAAESLFELAVLQRTSSIKLLRQNISAHVKSAKQRAQD